MPAPVASRRAPESSAGATPSRARVHAWVPDLFGPRNGIQVFSRFFLDAMRASLPGAFFGVTAKNDARAGAIDGLDVSVTGRWPAPSRTPAFAATIGARALLGRPDLIVTTHLHFARAASLLRRSIGTPYWVVAHGVEAWDAGPALADAMRRADLVIAVSAFTRDRIVDGHGLDPERVVVLPNTFDAASFDVGPKPQYLLERYGLTTDQPVVLTVGRLAASEGYKGHDRILRALADLRERLPGARYVVAGTGDDAERIRRLAGDLGLGDAVTLAGYVPDSELADHYRLCDVFAMPSSGEGFGIVFLEALACGRPVVAGSRDGAADALCGGRFGVLVDPDDTAGLASALLEIATRTHANTLLSSPRELRDAVVAEFGLDRFRERVASLVRERFPVTAGARSVAAPPREASL